MHTFKIPSVRAGPACIAPWLQQDRPFLDLQDAGPVVLLPPRRFAHRSPSPNYIHLVGVLGPLRTGPVVLLSPRRFAHRCSSPKYILPSVTTGGGGGKLGVKGIKSIVVPHPSCSTAKVALRF